MSEEWRPVVGHEGFYEVSALGRVRSLDYVRIRADGHRQGHRGRLLKLTKRAKGYPIVTLRGGATPTVHVLVCTAFHGPRPGPGFEVAHFNGVRADNRASNLRWATRSENSQDALRHGTLHIYKPGETSGTNNPTARLTWDLVDEMRAQWDSGQVTQRALARQYGMSNQQVSNVVRRRHWVCRPPDGIAS